MKIKHLSSFWGGEPGSKFDGLGNNIWAKRQTTEAAIWEVKVRQILVLQYKIQCTGDFNSFKVAQCTGLSAVIRQKSHVLENFSISVNNKILKWTFSERLTQEHLKDYPTHYWSRWQIGTDDKSERFASSGISGPISINLITQTKRSASF